MDAGRPLGTDDSTPFRDETDPYQAFVRSMQNNKATGPAKQLGKAPQNTRTPQQQALIMMILQMLLSGKR